MSQPRVPGYRLHKPSGLAVVSIAGRDYYLGRHGTPESQTEYERLIGEWLASGRVAPPVPRTGRRVTTTDGTDLTVGILVSACRRYHETKGTDAKTLERMELAFKPLQELYADTPVASFRPRALKAVRARLIGNKLSRWTVNERVWRIKNLFRWGTAEELVPPGTYQALAAVTNLRRGEEGVEDGREVKPVAWEHVDPVLDRVSPRVRAILELLWHTGARVGEIVAMRPKDIDRSETPWVYRLAAHKTAHHGKSRDVFFGPKAQAVLKPFLDRVPTPEPDLPVFTYRVPLRPGQRRRPPPRPYDVATIRHAIERGVERVNASRIRTAVVSAVAPLLTEAQGHGLDRHVQRLRANLHPDELTRRLRVVVAKLRISDATVALQVEALAGRVIDALDLVPLWHTHQLRHSAATRLRQLHGLESARVVLGHSSARVTDVYAEIDRAKARAIMEQAG